MNKLLKKITILAGVFVIAAGAYFMLAQNTGGKNDTVYTAMEEPSLPVVYTDVLGLEKNRLSGYVQEMNQVTARDSLTVLPEDRLLQVAIDTYGSNVLSVRYEIRSMDLNRLVERTEVSEWSDSEYGVQMSLPIQNLLTKGVEYLLHITVKTSVHEEVHYYTRVMLPESSYAEDMLVFAREFSEKTLDVEEAKSLVTYLESRSTEDNSSLGHVTIYSSFSQLTWAGLKMNLVDAMQVTLKELDGIMGQLQVQYQLSREAEDGTIEYYDVTDNYTMKWDPKRIYLMDFDRITTQVFMGNRDVYSGKRILLGIGNGEDIQVKNSLDKGHLAYVFNRELWSYEPKEAKAVKVFSFRSGAERGDRSSYDQHDIQVLSVSDSGNVDFLVYGYMNRGLHEGSIGVSLYQYDASEGTIQERFFVPVKSTFEALKQDIQKLTYLNSSEMLYLFIDSAIYGIDLNSNEYMVVADALEEGSYAISEDKRNLAWQEGQELYQAEAIHLLNLETGKKQEIKSTDGSYLRTLGFVKGDFVYGLAHPEDIWLINNRIEDLPMYALEIVNENLEIETRYEKSEFYLCDITVEDARVHMKRLAKSGNGQYIQQDEDTIVCNTASDQDKMAGIGWYASDIRRKLYFVQLDGDVKAGKNFKATVPKKITYDASDILELKSNRQFQDMMFYAYGRGHLLGSSSDFTKAVSMAYDAMGIVVNSNQEILWNRVNRSTGKTIRDPQGTVYNAAKHLEEFSKSRDFGDGVLMLDARGCMLSQMLYFIDQGCPVIAWVGEEAYLLIHGFDQYNVSLYNPETDQSYKMGINDAAEYFAALGNDFICWLPMK